MKCSFVKMAIQEWGKAVAKNIISRIDKNLARRLKEARREVGLSTRAVSAELPKKLRVSHSTIASYENGVGVPPIDVLGALATVYGRPINWFLETRDTLTDFQYRNLQSRVPLADQRTYAAKAGKWAEGYLALEAHLHRKRQSRWEDADGVPPAELANLIRTKHLNLDDTEAVLDTVAVLESFSTWAIELRADFGCDGAAAHFGEREIVVINPVVANERVRFNVSHELAFILYSKESRQSSVRVKEDAQTFACSLIMPDSQLGEAFRGKSFLRLIEFKERFGISLSAMIHRAEELQIINSTASRWLRSEIVKRGWRRSEPGYVWRDRALSFETMLESAIGMKELTLDEAERITSIPQEELKQRLLSASGAANELEEIEDVECQTLKFIQ